jgi:hypothetical protein
MTLQHDLLEQARHLANREPRRPRQASLRRAVSAGYYAVFHLLVADGAAMLTRSNPPALRAQVRRAFTHGDMKSVCRQFASGSLSQQIRPLITVPLEAQLKAVAEAFLALQEERNGADYDLARPFNRVDVLEIVDTAQTLFADWASVRTTANATVFLTALLLNRQWTPS